MVQRFATGSASCQKPKPSGPFGAGIQIEHPSFDVGSEVAVGEWQGGRQNLLVCEAVGEPVGMTDFLFGNNFWGEADLFYNAKSLEVLSQFATFPTFIQLLKLLVSTNGCCVSTITKRAS